MQQLLAQDARCYSTFGLPATLARVLQIQTVAELQSYQPSTPPLVLGEGSNSIFLTDWPGDVLRFVASNIRRVETGSDLHLHVEAGVNWHALVQSMVAEGWWGLENLALIPGSVGAAPVQNIGAYGVEFADCCEYVEFYDWKLRATRQLKVTECNFGYRDSIFKTELASQGVIVAVGLRLSRHGRPKLQYKGLDHLPENCTVAEVMAAVIAVRQSKLPDPAVLANCGSFFKNPVVQPDQFEQLLQLFPTIPYYPQPSEQVKLAAAWLIEQAGLKGYRSEHLGCYPQQPLVLVNYGAGTAGELTTLIALIQQRVLDKFSILLEPEVRLLACHD